MSNKNGFLLGAVLGAVAGGLAAIFLTPKAGKEMRKGFQKKCCEASEKTQEIIDGVSEQAKELAEKAKSFAHDAKDVAECLVKELRR